MAGAGEDDDAWLYGENAEAKRAENAAASENAGDVQLPGENTEEISETEISSSQNEVDGEDEMPVDSEVGEAADDEQKGIISDIVDGLEDGTIAPATEVEDGGSDDDDDSDDDVQVTIGDIKSAPTFSYGATPVNLNIKRSGGFAGAAVGGGIAKPKGIDLETVGTINGIAVYEFNLDSLEDKPWRKPGADITDYFNYGFNEDTWKIYCERQRKLRIDNNVVGKVHHAVGKDQHGIPISTVNENSKYATAAVVVGGVPLKKAGPPPGRKMSGSIDVIGGGTPSLPSRRPVNNAKENAIQVLAGRKPFELPPGMPPPPPHLAPTHLPPPNFLSADGTISIPPPPGTLPPPGLPPPNMPPPISGNLFADHFPPRFPPPSTPAPGSNQYEDHSGFYNGSQGGAHGPYDGQSETTQHSWGSSPRNRERDRDGGRNRERDSNRGFPSWDYPRDHDRERPSRGPPEEEYERRRHREYRGTRSRERDKERDRGSSFDKDYERDDRYERDRDRDRERRHKEHRERGEREERHRERSSRRRHHEEEHEHASSSTRSSRHKHKRSKKEKEEEATTPVVEMQEESVPPPVEEEEEGIIEDDDDEEEEKAE